VTQEKFLVQEPVHVRIVTTENSNRLPDKASAQSVQKGSILQIPTMPIHNALTVSTENINRLKKKMHVKIVQLGSLLQIQIMHTLSVRLALLGSIKGLLNKTTVTPSAKQGSFLVQVLIHAQIATTEDTKHLKHKAHVQIVRRGSLLQIQIMHTLSARLVLLGTTKRLLNKITVTPSVKQGCFLLQTPLHALHAMLDMPNPLKHRITATLHVQQASILQQARLNAHHVMQASILHQRLLHALHAMLDTTKGLQDKLLAYHVRQVHTILHHKALYAQIATTENTKTRQGRVTVKRAWPESLQRMTIPPNPRARIASLAATNQVKDKPHASNAILESIKRPRDKPCAQNVPRVCSLPRPLQRMNTFVCSVHRGSTPPYQPRAAPHA
jgi:hypothetical protein